MAYRTSTAPSGRDVYFNKTGVDNQSGLTHDNVVSSPERAIEIVNAFIIPPSSFVPASINAAETGTYFEGLVIPDFCGAKCDFASLRPTSATTTLTLGNQQEAIFGNVGTFVDGGTGVILDGKERVVFDINSLIVGDAELNTTGSINNVGVDIRGTVNNVFGIVRKMSMLGDGMTGISHTADSPNPIDYMFSGIEVFNRNQTFFHMNTANPTTDLVVVVFETLRESQDAIHPVTGFISFDIEAGRAIIDGQTGIGDFITRADGVSSFSADVWEGDILVEAGGGAAIPTLGLLIGDVIVEEGATLRCEINNHFGTVTGAERIDGHINCVAYGNCKLLPQILTSQVTGQVLVSENTGNVLISGEAA